MIETERLILRPPVDGDRASVVTIGADPEVGRWLGGVRDRAASDLLVDRCLEHLERFGFGIGVIERKADRRVIGMAGLGYVPDGLPEEGEVEIGWRLLSEVWGQGYATEAARAWLAEGFQKIGATEIVAFTARINVASQKVMRRIGMVATPDRDFDHPLVAEGDPLRPHVTWIARP